MALTRTVFRQLAASLSALILKIWVCKLLYSNGLLLRELSSFSLYFAFLRMFRFALYFAFLRMIRLGKALFCLLLCLFRLSSFCCLSFHLSMFSPSSFALSSTLLYFELKSHILSLIKRLLSISKNKSDKLHFFLSFFVKLIIM